MSEKHNNQKSASSTPRTPITDSDSSRSRSRSRGQTETKRTSHRSGVRGAKPKVVNFDSDSSEDSKVRSNPRRTGERDRKGQQTTSLSDTETTNNKRCHDRSVIDLNQTDDVSLNLESPRPLKRPKLLPNDNNNEKKQTKKKKKNKRRKKKQKTTKKKKQSKKKTAFESFWDELPVPIKPEPVFSNDVDSVSDTDDIDLRDGPWIDWGCIDQISTMQILQSVKKGTATPVLQYYADCIYSINPVVVSGADVEEFMDGEHVPSTIVQLLCKHLCVSSGSNLAKYIYFNSYANVLQARDQCNSDNQFDDKHRERCRRIMARSLLDKGDHVKLLSHRSVDNIVLQYPIHIWLVCSEKRYKLIIFINMHQAISRFFAEPPSLKVPDSWITGRHPEILYVDSVRSVGHEIPLILEAYNQYLSWLAVRNQISVLPSKRDLFVTLPYPCMSQSDASMPIHYETGSMPIRIMACHDETEVLVELQSFVSSIHDTLVPVDLFLSSRIVDPLYYRMEIYTIIEQLWLYQINDGHPRQHLIPFRWALADDVLYFRHVWHHRKEQRCKWPSPDPATACQCVDNPQQRCSGGVCANRSSRVECYSGRNCNIEKVSLRNDRWSVCSNRRIQKSHWMPVELRTHGAIAGRGVFTLMDIHRGEMILEYTGIVYEKDFYLDKVLPVYQKRNDDQYYVVDLGPVGDDQRKHYYIDCQEYKCYAAFMNHSCEPNCAVEKWEVGGEARLIFFATDNIPANTELTYRYNFALFDSMETPRRCLCGANTCKGWLGQAPSVAL